jgi:leader peptidase (prepilin peptidase) / N-methyltransferase
MLSTVAVTAVGCAGVGAALGPALAGTAARVPGVVRGTGRTVLVSGLAAAAFGGVVVGLLPDAARRYALPAFLVLAAAGVLLGVIDADVHRLPDMITLPAYPVVAALLVPASVLAGSSVGWGGLARAGAGALAAATLYAALCLPPSSPMGFGDVKLAGLLGLALGWLSWQTWMVGMVLGFGYGGLHGLAVLARRRAGSHRIPFGPAMLVGALTAVLAGDHLLAAYQTL